MIAARATLGRFRAAVGGFLRGFLGLGAIIADPSQPLASGRSAGQAALPCAERCNSPAAARHALAVRAAGRPGCC